MRRPLHATLFSSSAARAKWSLGRGTAGTFALSPPGGETGLVPPSPAVKPSKIVGGLEKRGFVAGAAEELKVAPRGVDPAHPRLGLLKKKGLVMEFPPIPPGAIGKRAFVDWVVGEAKRVVPLVTWLTFETL
jgi:hypothetical protein